MLTAPKSSAPTTSRARQPGREDDQRQRDPAAAGGHVGDPLRRVDQRQVAAGEPGAGAAEQHRQEADADHAVAERMGRDVVVADGAEDRARRGCGTGTTQTPTASATAR